MKNQIFLVLFFGFFLRLIVAIWNGYFGPSLGAEYDAVAFHEAAIHSMGKTHFQEIKIGWVYSEFLSIIYEFTSPSLFFGSVTSIIIWLFSAILLYKTTDLLGMPRKQKFWVITLFCLTPSLILFTSVTLREAVEIFFVNLSLYVFFKIYLENKFKYYVIGILSILLSSKLHIALLIPTCLLFFFAIYLRLYNSLRFNFMIVFFMLYLFSSILFINLYSYENDQLLNLIQKFYMFSEKASSIEARANYRIFENSLNILDVINIIILYFLEPIPNRSFVLSDFGIMIENMMRLFMVILSFLSLFKHRGDDQKLIFLILIVYLLSEFTWALGSFNYGTAIRHHAISFGMLLITSLSYFKNKSGFYKNP
jgi:hypothetical protein